MVNKGTLAKEEFDEYLDYIMSDCDIAESLFGQFAIMLLDAGLAENAAAARKGALRALKYLLCNGYLQAFSVPGPIEMRQLLTDSPDESYEMIAENWDEDKLLTGEFIAWLYPTEKGLKWCQDLKDKGWTLHERYRRV